MNLRESFSAMLEKLFPVVGRKRASLPKTARRSFYLSLGIHGLLVFAASAWVISHIFLNKESTFSGTPPPMKSYEPRKLEFKVKVSKQARSSSRPSMVPRMVSARMSDFALPEIKMDPKVVKTSFQPKFKAFSGTGLGAGLGTGYGLGGFGSGVAAFDFFGIRGRGDKIAVLVDVSISMVEDIRGGPNGYQRVKDRINKVIDELNEGAMFNVIVFADAASTWQNEMAVAMEDNKTKAKQWLKPYNSAGNLGLTSGNVSSSNMGVPAHGGTTRLDLALTAAFLQGADTILIISDGLPMVKKGYTAQQMQGFQDQQARWMQEHANQMRAWQQQMAAFSAAPVAPVVVASAPLQVQSTKVWIPPTPAVPARPPKTTGLKEGQAPDPGTPGVPAQPGRWEVRTVTVGGPIHQGGGGGGGPPPPPRPTPPPIPDPGFWTLGDFVQHLKILHEALYIKKGKKLPSIHSIGYAIDKEGGDFLKALSEQYKGRYRRVAKID